MSSASKKDCSADGETSMSYSSSDDIHLFSCSISGVPGGLWCSLKFVEYGVTTLAVYVLVHCSHHTGVGHSQHSTTDWYQSKHYIHCLHQQYV